MLGTLIRALVALFASASVRAGLGPGSHLRVQNKGTAQFRPTAYEDPGPSSRMSTPLAGPQPPADTTIFPARCAAYWIDGKIIPNVTWDIGNSYAGLMPVNDDADNKREVRCTPPYEVACMTHRALSLLVIFLVLPARS